MRTSPFTRNNPPTLQSLPSDLYTPPLVGTECGWRESLGPFRKRSLNTVLKLGWNSNLKRLSAHIW